MCHTHYAHFLASGDPLAGKFFNLRESTLADKLLQELEASGNPQDGCWEFQGKRLVRGYGQIWHDGHFHYLHRVSYEHFVGPIPTGLDIDHLCRNRKCLRPDHLEPVTRRENIQRGYAARRELASQ